MQPVLVDAPHCTVPGLGGQRMLSKDSLAEASLAREKLGLLNLGQSGSETSSHMEGVFDGVASTGLLRGLQELGHAAAILNQTGLVIGMNARCEKQVGQTIVLRSGRLSAMSRDANTRLQRLVTSLLESDLDRDPIIAALLPSRNEQQFVVRGTRIAPSGLDIFSHAKALLTFTLVGKTLIPRATMLRDIFGLTASEASIALSIANGEDPKAIAVQRNISVDTVRSHLKAIFCKTNTRRQVALAILVTRLHDILRQD